MPVSSVRLRYLGRTAVASLIVAMAAALAIGGQAGATSTTPPGSPPVATDPRPNVVVILTDDQRRDSMRYMPQVQRLLVQQGTRYTQAMVPTSLCCPSRATILTGRYAHTTRVFGNGDVGGARHGGWRRFFRTGSESRTIAVTLKRAGYSTAMVGKYLNYFGKHAPAGYVPPGWDTFSTFMSNHGRYYDYLLNDGTFHGHAPEDYSTDVMASKAVDFVRATPPSQPLFLFFAPYGPHSPYTPAPRHDGAMGGLLPDYTAPTLDQPLRTMPEWMRSRVHVTKSEADWTRQKQHEALLSVDEAVAGIHDALVATGRDRNTLYLFLSDNGYFWGEHKIIGKDTPYKDSTYIPMVARWDGHVPAGATDSRIALNVDLARTIAKAAGTSMSTDGLNLFGPARRKGVVLEAMEGYHSRPAYCGWRTKTRMFVQWATGERELFDYRLDPDEERNLAYRKAWRDVRQSMRRQAVEACSPEPPKFSW
jgi:N-acetylglucosamine-6-sulfatase